MSETTENPVVETTETSEKPKKGFKVRVRRFHNFAKEQGLYAPLLLVGVVGVSVATAVYDRETANRYLDAFSNKEELLELESPEIDSDEVDVDDLTDL